MSGSEIRIESHQRSDAPEAGRSGKALRLLLMLPLLGFLLVGGILFWGLDPARDLSTLPSALVGKPVPEFKLPPVKGRSLGLATGDLKGEIALVNVFASWCAACRAEHPLLMQLKEEGHVVVHGLNYKDKPDDAATWLDALGDPYQRTGADESGRVGLDWGVYGVPETFIVGQDGRIAYRHVGPLTPAVLKKTIFPLIEALQ